MDEKTQKHALERLHRLQLAGNQIEAHVLTTQEQKNEQKETEAKGEQKAPEAPTSVAPAPTVIAAATSAYAPAPLAPHLG